MTDTREWIATADFTDWDGVKIKAGTVLGRAERKGRSGSGEFFWNCIRDGRVTCVTVGFPRNVAPIEDKA